MSGKVTFIGAGSGDPRLLTVRAAQILAEASSVYFDPDVHPDVLARAPERAERRSVNPNEPAEILAAELAVRAKAGESVVRLTWGDPLFFGTADAEAHAVARFDVPIEIVPGIGPLIAVGAFAGVPLTRSSDVSASVAAVSVSRGHEGLHDWDRLARATDTLAIVSDAASVAEVARSLVFYGRASDEHVTLVEDVSLPSQRTLETTLGQVPLLPPARTQRVVLVVGERSTRLPSLSWLERQPLFGKRVLVTRAREQAGSAADLLRARGADPVVMPTIEIHPPSDPGPMQAVVPGMGARYAWIVLTSANGVERLFAEVRRQGLDARAFAPAKVAAIGPATAKALEKVGIVPDLMANEHRGEALAEALLEATAGARAGGETPRVLLARAAVARDVLPDALRAAGCEVDVVPVYETRMPPAPILEAIARLLEAGDIDAVTFTSSSTVTHLCDALSERAAELLARTCVASIGPITTDTAEKRGVRVDVSAETYTVPGLVAALEAHFEGGYAPVSGLRGI